VRFRAHRHSACRLDRTLNVYLDVLFYVRRTRSWRLRQRNRREQQSKSWQHGNLHRDKSSDRTQRTGKLNASQRGNVTGRTNFVSIGVCLQPLQNPRGSHPPADAHGHHAVAGIASLQFAQNRRRQFRPCAPQRMPKGNRAPIWIHARRIEPSLLNHRQRLRRKRLIQFEHRDVVQGQPRQFQRLRNRRHRPDPKLLRQHPSRRIRHKSRQRFQSQRLRAFLAHHHRRRRSIAHLRTIPRRHRSLNVKRRLQLSQSLQRSVRPRPFIRFKRKSLRRPFFRRLFFCISRSSPVPVRHRRNLHFNRHRLVPEMPRRNSRQRLLVRLDRKLVRLLPRNPKLPRDVFRSQPHIDVRIRIVIHQPRIRRNLVAPHRHHGHRLCPTRHNHLRCTRANPLRRNRNRLQTRRTKPVHRHRRSLHRQPRAQRRNPRHVHLLVPLRHRAPKNHIINFLGIQSRHSRQRFLNSQRRQIIRARRPQRSFKRLSNRCSNRRNNHS